MNNPGWCLWAVAMMLCTGHNRPEREWGVGKRSFMQDSGLLVACSRIFGLHVRGPTDRKHFLNVKKKCCSVPLRLH